MRIISYTITLLLAACSRQAPTPALPPVGATSSPAAALESTPTPALAPTAEPAPAPEPAASLPADGDASCRVVRVATSTHPTAAAGTWLEVMKGLAIDLGTDDSDQPNPLPNTEEAAKALFQLSGEGLQLVDSPDMSMSAHWLLVMPSDKGPVRAQTIYRPESGPAIETVDATIVDPAADPVVVRKISWWGDEGGDGEFAYRVIEDDIFDRATLERIAVVIREDRKQSREGEGFTVAVKPDGLALGGCGKGRIVPLPKAAAVDLDAPHSPR